MKQYSRYLAITLTAMAIVTFFYLGLRDTFTHLYRGIAEFLALAVWAICMNGLDKPFHDLPGEK